MSDQREVRTAIAARLRTARELAGLSQGQVARLLDMQRPTISEMEAGRRRVSADELVRLASTYCVSVSWLVTADEEEQNPNWHTVQLVAREISKLKPDDLERLLRLLSTLR